MRKLASHPGAGEVPVAADSAWRDLQDLSNLFIIKAAKIAEFEHFGLARSELREGRKCVVQSDDGTVRPGRGEAGLIEIYTHVAPAAFVCVPCARGIHQNSPHHLPRDREKLRAVPPLDVFGV